MALPRRNFIQNIFRFLGLIFIFPVLKTRKKQLTIMVNNPKQETIKTLSKIYVSDGHSPVQNMKNIIQMVGGIERIVDKEDVVIIKPNAQWWHQGTTNTNTIKGFVDSILNIPGFSGEIIIAENHHYHPDNSLGWTTKFRNGDFNLNELVEYYNNRGIKNVTKYHWRDGGPNPKPREGNASDRRIVTNVEEGDGYVWREDLVYVSPEKRKCMMTYPIFTSKYSGRSIDLKEGVWEHGKFTKNIKLINFSCLNHHSDYCGVTAAIKNLMGVVDLTCGFHGILPEGYYNVHFIGSMSNSHRLGLNINYYLNRIGIKNRTIRNYFRKHGGFNFQYTGGALGYWINTIKKPDLNIIAAEWIGWGSRIDTKMRYQAKTTLASTDPLALDYFSAKNYLLPVTKRYDKENYFVDFNDPDNMNGPFRKFLEESNKQGIGTLHEDEMKIYQYNHQR